MTRAAGNRRQGAGGELNAARWERIARRLRRMLNDARDSRDIARRCVEQESAALWVLRTERDELREACDQEFARGDNLRDSLVSVANERDRLRAGVEVLAEECERALAAQSMQSPASEWDRGYEGALRLTLRRLRALLVDPAAEDRAAMSVEPNPPGATLRAFTTDEAAAFDRSESKGRNRPMSDPTTYHRAEPHGAVYPDAEGRDYSTPVAVIDPTGGPDANRYDELLEDEGIDFNTRVKVFRALARYANGEDVTAPAESYCLLDSHGDWWVSDNEETGWKLQAQRMRGGLDPQNLDYIEGKYGIDPGVITFQPGQRV